MPSAVDLQILLLCLSSVCGRIFSLLREFFWITESIFILKLSEANTFLLQLKYFCCYFQNSIVFQPVPLPVLKFGFESIGPTVPPLRLQITFTESQGYSLELYIKWRVTHSWKTFKYCFLLLYCALNLVLPPSHECSIIHRLCITTSIAFGSKWRCCSFPAVKMLPCI